MTTIRGATGAVAMPASAPDEHPPVSTTSEPAGLQYRRTLYPPAPSSAERTITTRMMNRKVPKTAKTSSYENSPSWSATLYGAPHLGNAHRVAVYADES